MVVVLVPQSCVGPTYSHMLQRKVPKAVSEFLVGSSKKDDRLYSKPMASPLYARYIPHQKTLQTVQNEHLEPGERLQKLSRSEFEATRDALTCGETRPKKSRKIRTFQKAGSVENHTPQMSSIAIPDQSLTRDRSYGLESKNDGRKIVNAKHSPKREINCDDPGSNKARYEGRDFQDKEQAGRQKHCVIGLEDVADLTSQNYGDGGYASEDVLQPTKLKEYQARTESIGRRDTGSINNLSTSPTSRDESSGPIPGQDLGKVDELTAKAANHGFKHKSILAKFQTSRKMKDLPKCIVAEATKEQRMDKEYLTDDAAEPQGLTPLPQPAPVADPMLKPKFSALPHWLANPINISSVDTSLMRDLPLSAKFSALLEARGFKESFAVQSAVLPLLLPGPSQKAGDICISAATGSGKTLAYVLPIVESLRSRIITKLRGVIVVPTRELVIQVKEACELCIAGSDLKVGTALGNRPLKVEQEILVKRGQKYDLHGFETRISTMETQAEKEALATSRYAFDIDEDLRTLPGHVAEFSSKIDILICTPGRLVDHIRHTKGFTMDNVQWLVIDEADRLLGQSFQEWVDTVMRALEAEKSYEQVSVGQQVLLDMGYQRERRDIRKVVLSATMTRDVEKLNSLKLKQPRLIVVDKSADGSVEEVAEGENSSPRDARWDDGAKESFTLPPMLQEWVISITDGNEKPLHLFQLLQTKLKPYTEGRNVQKHGPHASSDSPGSSDVSEPEENPASKDHSTSTYFPSGKSASALHLAGNVPRQLHHHRKSMTLGSAMANRPTHGVLIFTNNNENATRLTRLLRILHPQFAPHIGTLTKTSATSANRKTLSKFREGRLSILIASDRASRGLDVPELAHIVNYDIPLSVTGYVHRVGRTARAGKEGQAWTFVTSTEARWFWNEIAKGSMIRRGNESKVVRVKINMKSVGDEERKKYELALRILQEEVQRNS
ncbi:MAG: ATP-dependent RNA helicase dbp6 [Pycnora praestabilis]|nr:MAG: ATP-dependent RNA helicase dbp6 [Pycnora praestabilis]